MVETGDDLAISASIARSAAHIVDDIDAKLVVTWSETGATARLLSKARIDVPILAISSDPAEARRMCLHYGVMPRSKPVPTGIEELIAMAEEMIIERNWAKPGDKLVFVTGKPIGQPGATRVFIHTM